MSSPSSLRHANAQLVTSPFIGRRPGRGYSLHSVHHYRCRTPIDRQTHIRAAIPSFGGGTNPLLMDHIAATITPSGGQGHSSSWLYATWRSPRPSIPAFHSDALARWGPRQVAALWRPRIMSSDKRRSNTAFAARVGRPSSLDFYMLTLGP